MAANKNQKSNVSRTISLMIKIEIIFAILYAIISLILFIKEPIMLMIAIILIPLIFAIFTLIGFFMAIYYRREISTFYFIINLIIAFTAFMCIGSWEKSLVWN